MTEEHYLDVFEYGQHVPLERYRTRHPDPMLVARRFLRFWNTHYGQPGGVWPMYSRVVVLPVTTTWGVFGGRSHVVRERRRRQHTGRNHRTGKR